MGSGIESYSIPIADKPLIEPFLEEYQKKGISKSKIVIIALKQYIQAEQERARLAAKPVKLSSLGNCPIPVVNNNGKSNSSKSVDESLLKFRCPAVEDWKPWTIDDLAHLTPEEVDRLFALLEKKLEVVKDRYEWQVFFKHRVEARKDRLLLDGTDGR